MPVPASNLYPSFNTVRLSHACLNVADLAESKTFYTQILGMQVSDETDSHIYLRAMKERGHHSVILQHSDQPGSVEVMGFKTYDEQDLDRAEAHFNAQGCPTEWVGRPYQGRTLRSCDNISIPLNFNTKWTACPPCISNMPYTAASNRCGLTTSIAFRQMWMPQSHFITISGFASRNIPKMTRVAGSRQRGCTGRAACMIWPSPMAPAHACIISHFGYQPHSISSTFWI